MTKAIIQITASDIQRLIEEKHWKDVCVTECKDGPSSIGLLKLDAWVMKRSWAHPLTIGYEFKVSRADFLQDSKWHGYLEFCNEFYFVCPSGVIKPEELSPEVGLLVVAKTGTRMFTKKKAPYRDAIVPESLYRYILMARSKITKPRFSLDPPKERSRKAYWESWMEHKTIDRDFGLRVSKKIAETVQKRILDVESKNEILQKNNQKLAAIQEALESLGINWEWMRSYNLEEKLKEKVEKALNATPNGLSWELEHAVEALQKIQEIFKNPEIERS